MGKVIAKIGISKRYVYLCFRKLQSDDAFPVDLSLTGNELHRVGTATKKTGVPN